ncbi:2-hydroxyhepta-2,4-diene-1,7-dioate isomerase [Acephala macrosclerotiorum]|nr:2-hydroxyhepta-2,4-diene-1,7-dioate isomerase [Acephala macrosclerotiorum]
MASWDSLIRFVASEDGSGYWAALPLDIAPVVGLSVDGFSSIKDLEGGGPPKKVTVKKLLAPTPNTSIPIYCIGLNYKSHAIEANLTPPPCAPMWFKPAAGLANHDEDILFPTVAHTNFPDYEGELTIIIRDSIKSISKSEAISSILGYTIGNDLTARLFQDPKRTGGQYTYAKAFDAFAPLGPRLIHPSKFTPSSPTTITTRVNGTVMQHSPLDFIYPVDELVSYLSQGTTIPSGSAIMTGTPAGVGWFQDPKKPLQDGDIVEVEIQPIGILRNKIVFEK